MAKQEHKNGAKRLAFHFCRTVGLFLGVLSDPRGKFPQVVKDAQFSAIEADFLRLLEAGWAESEIEVILFQAFKDKKKEAVPGRLFLGRTPLLQRNNPGRNLLEHIPKEDLVYHPQIASREMPRVRVSSGGLTVTNREKSETQWVSSYTLKDLRHYWETFAQRAVLLEEGEEIDRQFLPLLENHNVSVILRCIDLLFEEQSGKSLSVRYLKSYLATWYSRVEEAKAWL